MLTKTVDQVINEIKCVLTIHARPILVALDGGSGAGKSDLADLVVRQTHVAKVQLDGFFSVEIPDAQWDGMTAKQKLRNVFQWQRVRAEALEPLFAGRSAKWHEFDFASGQRPDGTWGTRSDYVEVHPAPVILLEGAYSASQPLSDLVDLAVLVDVPTHERHRRMAVRDDADFLQHWHDRWDEVEAYYFQVARPSDSFDLVVENPAAD